MKVANLRVGILGLSALAILAGGCAQETPSRSDVPSNAVQMSSGGKVVAFTAPHDGKAYLHDDTDNRVVYSTDLTRDQLMRFDPATASVRINGTAAPEGIARPDHDHSIYFSRSAQPDRVDAGSNAVNANSDQSIPTIRVPIGVKVDVQTQPSAPN